MIIAKGKDVEYDLFRRILASLVLRCGVDFAPAALMDQAIKDTDVAVNWLRTRSIIEEYEPREGGVS